MAGVGKIACGGATPEPEGGAAPSKERTPYQIAQAMRLTEAAAWAADCGAEEAIGQWIAAETQLSGLEMLLEHLKARQEVLDGHLDALLGDAAWEFFDNYISAPDLSSRKLAASSACAALAKRMAMFR